MIEVFKTAQRFQRNQDTTKYVSVVVLDEVGLAEDSPNLPLKVLHPLLEDGTEGADDKQEVGSVSEGGGEMGDGGTKERRVKEQKGSGLNYDVNACKCGQLFLHFIDHFSQHLSFLPGYHSLFSERNVWPSLVYPTGLWTLPR